MPIPYQLYMSRKIIKRHHQFGLLHKNTDPDQLLPVLAIQCNGRESITKKGLNNYIESGPGSGVVRARIYQLQLLSHKTAG